MKHFKLNLNKIDFIVYWIVILYASLLLTASLKPYGEQQFSSLAGSFLLGKLDLGLSGLRIDDSSFFQGKYYWPLGPFPALILMPFVWLWQLFGLAFYQRYLHWVVSLGVIYVVFLLGKKLKFDRNTSLFWAFAFGLGSVFIGVSLIPFSWYFAQVVCTLLIFLALLENFGKKRSLIVGILFAFIFLTRATAVIGIIFFIMQIFGNRKIDLRKKFKEIFMLLFPIAVSVLVLLAYNLARFGNIFEQGYKYQIISGGTLAARSYGLFSLRHVPGNLYYFLVAPPDTISSDFSSKVLKFPFFSYNSWGLGIIFTSPYLLKLFFVKLSKEMKNLVLTAFVVSVPIFLYYGIGYRQFGYRYSLDFLPYLFSALMIGYKGVKISKKMIFAIYITIFSNLYLLTNGQTA